MLSKLFAFLMSSGVLLLHGECFAIPFTPASESEIVERLPAGSQNTRRTLRILSAGTKESAGDKEVSQEGDKERLAEARRLIQSARAEGDPRSLGYAEAVLLPLTSGEKANGRALVLKATVQQARHDFTSALETLDRALKIDSEDAQAWLTRAMIFRAQGRFEEARKSCGQLLRTADEFTLALCAASVSSVAGHAKEAYRTLSAVTLRWSEAPVPSRLWAQTLLAEIAEQIGEDDQAARHYSEAIVLEHHDVYLLTIYSDFLLRRGKPQAVLALLHGLEKHDGLLLRLALAAKAANSLGEYEKYQNDFNERIQAARLRGSSIHLREEAIFELELRGNVQQALSLAKQNFQVQREIADVQILLKSAQSAGDDQTVETTVQWLANNQIEDVRLKELL